MNIFVLDSNTIKCAEYHNDKHCVKMILESTQLLCGVHWVSGGQAPYQLTHLNHPCSIWARQSLGNYLWLLSLGFALCDEYGYRYGKKHKCETILNWCEKNIPEIEDNGSTPFALAMPDLYKKESAIESYRAYYMGDKRHIATWKKRETPFWFL